MSTPTIESLEKQVSNLHLQLHELKQPKQPDVTVLSEHLKAFCKYCESRQIKPKRFKWEEIIKDFESIYLP